MGEWKSLLHLWIATLIVCTNDLCLAEGNVGCLFSQTICLKTEWCYDDYAFGKCLPIYGDVPEADKFRYSMTKYDLGKFENELQRLVQLGFHWEHMYTQCVLQSMLQGARIGRPVEIGACDELADRRNYMFANPDNAKKVNPQELAFVKFTPNVGAKVSDFADEVYLPSQVVGDAITSIDSEFLGGPKGVNPLGIEINDNFPQKSFDNSIPERIITPPNNFRNYNNLLELLGSDKISRDAVNSEELSEMIKYLNQYQNYHPIQDVNESLLKVAKKNVIFPDKNNNIGIVEFPAMEDYSDINKNEDIVDSLDSNDDENNYDFHYTPTAEYLTENRLNPEQMVLFSNYINSIKQEMDDKLEDNDLDDNNIPESRIYVDEDEPDIFRVDSGSGEFRPKDIFDNFDGNIAIEGPIADIPDVSDLNQDPNKITNLLSYLAERNGKYQNDGSPPNDYTVIYTEGGLVFPLDKGIKSNDQLRHLMKNNYYDLGFKRPERLDVKKPGPPFDAKITNKEENKTNTKNLTKTFPPAAVKKAYQSDPYNHEHNHNDFDVDTSYTYVGLKETIRTWKQGAQIVHMIEELLHLEPTAFSYPRVDRNEVTFRVNENSRGFSAIDVARNIDEIKDELKNRLGVEVISAGVGDMSKEPAVMMRAPDSWKWAEWMEWGWGGWGIIASIVILAITSTVMLILVIRKNARQRSKLQGLATDVDSEATQHYQDLCRARMSGKQQSTGTGILGSILDTGAASAQRVTSLSRDSDGNSPSNRSSTSSWSEEPALTNMDISTGHMVLAYMEDHLKNKDRLEQEWEALCAYDAEPCTTLAAMCVENVKKNRYPDVLPYDHARVALNQLTNQSNSDYINASTITDHDPRNPAYIATQGPLPHTTPDFWQMVWEQGSVVMVMLTRLTENGTVMCHRYWSEEGSALYHIYEVHLVSEHIWCDDYLVRSFYLKNVKTGETRTVTQFHFLSWPENGVPSSTKALLEFRRKVNKSYRGRSCPIVVHCSDGASRTGTYCLIDMVLNRMAKGAKEIDIAATLEHIRDQRPNMVTTKQQFEFVLMAVAEEVHAILKALPSQLQQQKEASKEKEKESV